MKRFQFFLASFLILLSTVSFADDLNAKLEEFRKFATRQMKEDQIPGLTIGFLRWGDQEPKEWVEAFGYSDLENQQPAKRDSAYRLGSVSKPQTAAAVLLLAEKGKLDLDAEVQKYVPYFPKKKWPVTVRQLLGHIGGISHYKNYEVEGRIKEHKNTREAIAIFESFDLVAEPGTKYSYSSYGYNLAAAAVEGASGMPFGEFMKQNVWGPLQMDATRLDDPNDLIPNRVRGYRLLNGRLANSEFVNISSRLGGGGTRSTVPDMLRFAKGIATQQLLSAKSTELVFNSMTTRDGKFTNYSTGWSTDPANGHFFLRHSGSQQETATILFCFPKLKLAIAAAVNQEDAGATIFARRLYELITGERWGVTAYAPGHVQLYRAMDSVFSSGMSYFERHKSAMTSDPGKLRQAFEYFQKSIDESPQSAELIQDGAHPVAGEPFTQLGSHIAQEIIRNNPDRMNSYHVYGPVRFFADYIKISGRKNSFPETFRSRIAEWNKTWDRTYAPEIQQVQIDPDSDFQAIGSKLQKTFESASIYPDFSRRFSDLTWSFLMKGQNEKSLEAGALGVALYPQSSRLLAIYGITQTALSQQEAGEASLRKAYQLDPESPAEPLWLSDFAEELALSGKINEALRVMQSAVALHPNNAAVLSNMGEAYLANNEQAKAREYFEKALSVDPNFERAKSMLKKISTH